MKHLLLTVLILSLLSGCATTQNASTREPSIESTACIMDAGANTVGLRFCSEDMFRSYTLFAPLLVPKAYLIDHLGRKVHEWNLKNRPAGIVKLLDNGMLLTTGRPDADLSRFDNGGPNIGGLFRLIDWDSNVVWEYSYYNNEHQAHHDALMMPNGNILIVAWEPKTREQAIAMGRNPAMINKKNMIMPDHLIEVKPLKEGGDIVWEWHVWDHLVQNFDSNKPNYGEPQQRPERIDINYPPSDSNPSWNHINGLDYNEKLDQIVMSSLRFNELWVIDHSTTTAEAASHFGGKSGKGGDLLYRWGNPQAYGAGTDADRVFYLQHNAQWVRAGFPGAGHLLVFNNGKNRADGDFSSVDELIPELDRNGGYVMRDGRYAPDRLAWSYRSENPKELFSEKISGVQRLPNGNTFICSGMNGQFFEVTFEGRKVWDYVNPASGDGTLAQGERPRIVNEKRDSMMNNAVFRASRIAPDHPGLKNRDLTPKGVIERIQH